METNGENLLDNLTPEERAEMDVQCDLWREEAIAAQEAEISEKKIDMA